MVRYYGFLADENWLLQRGLRLGLGTDRSLMARLNMISASAWDLMCCARVADYCTLAKVCTVGDRTEWCIALASTDPTETVYTHRRMPPQEVINRVKAVLKKKDGVVPGWYKSTG